MSSTARAPEQTRPPRGLGERIVPGIGDESKEWQRAISRGARLVVGLTAGFGTLGAIGPAMSGTGWQFSVTPGSALLTLSLVALIVDLVKGHRNRWAVPAVISAFGLGVILTLPYTIAEDFSPADQWWPSGPMSTTLLYGVVMTRRWSRWLAVSAIVLLHVVTRILYWPELSHGPSWEMVALFAVEIGGLLMLALGAGIGLAVVTRVARQVDRALADERRSEQALAEKDRKDRRSRAVDRFVHDEVLHALRMIALDRDGLPGAEAQAGARRLASLLDAEVRPEGTARAGLSGRLSHLGSNSPLTVTVSGDDMLLPDHIEAAFVSAAGEALHNTALHAGVQEAHVHVTVVGSEVSVRIEDAGRGFVTQRKDGRHGITDSILGRMHDVGGHARVESEPGAGTTVVLSWAPRPDEYAASGAAAFSVVRRFYPAVVTAILPFAVGLLWTEAWLAATLASPAAGWIAIVVTIGVFASLAAKALRHGLTWRDSLIATVAAWGATFLNGLALPSSGQVGHYLWMSGGAVILMALVSQFRPPWESVVIGIGIQAEVAYSCIQAFGIRDAIIFHLPTLTLPLLCTAVALTVRWILESMARAIGRSEANVVRGLEVSSDRGAFMEELNRRVGRRHEAVGLFIDGVASGAIDIDDPVVRARAAELERTIRESLFAPPEGILDHALRRVRDAGVTLEVRVSGDVPPPIQTECARALEVVGGAEIMEAQLTVMPGADGWRVSVTADGLGRTELRRFENLELLGWAVRAHEGSARAVRLVTIP